MDIRVVTLRPTLKLSFFAKCTEKKLLRRKTSFYQFMIANISEGIVFNFNDWTTY